ncbi:hypothetical protein FQZ97_550690 [compost metagenome]
MFAARFGQRQRGRQHGAAHAEAQRVDLRLSGDVAGHPQGLQHGVVEVVGPGGAVHAVGIAGDGIAPRNQEHREALIHRVPHEGILGLQVQDVELVDVRRHDDDRPRVHGRGRRRVLNELEQGVFVHDLAGRHRHVAADLELRFVRLRNAPFLDVAKQVREPFVQCPARALHDRLLGVRVQCQEIGRRQGVDPLHDRKAQAVAHGFADLRGIHHARHRASGQQVGMRQQQVRMIGGPGLAGKTAVRRRRERAAAGVIAKALPFARELGLDVGQDFRCHAHRNGPCGGEIGIHFDTLLSKLRD